MPQENVERVYATVDAIRRQDVDALLEHLAPDVAIIPLSAEMEGTVHRGHEGARVWLNNLLSVFPEFSPEIESVRDLGDFTLVAIRQHAQGAESHAPIDLTTWIVVQWSGDKAIAWRTYREEHEALEAVGLSEQAMTRENEQLVRSAFDAWNRDDLEAQLEMIHPEIEYVPSGLFPGLAPIYRGHSGYKDFWRDFKQTWESLRIEIDDLREVEVGEQYVVLFTFEGRARDGLTVRRQFGNVVSVRDRLAVRIEAFGSWAEALEAVGLSE